MTHTPNDREAAEWLNMLAAQLERPSRCGMYRNIPGLSAGQVYDIAQDMRSAIALLQSPAAPDGGEVADAMFAARGFALNVRDQERRQITTPGHASSSVIECERWLDTFERLLFAFTPPGNDKPRPWRELESAPQSPAAVQQGEASVSTLPDLYWHITRNALRDGSPFAVACMGALPALNAVIATPSPASPEVTDEYGRPIIGYARPLPASPEVGGLVDAAMRERIRQASYAAHSPDDGMGDYADKVIDATLAALAPTRQAGGEAVDVTQLALIAATLRRDLEDRPECGINALCMKNIAERIEKSLRVRDVQKDAYSEAVKQFPGNPAQRLSFMAGVAYQKHTHPAPSAESADAILDIVGRHVDRETYSAIVRERYDRLAAAPTAIDEGKAHG